MKRSGLVIIMGVCAVLLFAVLAGCGGTASNPATTATTAGATSTSASTAAGSSDALAKYKTDMKAWVDKYDADLTKKVAVLETILDPLNATEDQIQGTKDFTNLAAEAASSLEDIQPPADLASAHQAYTGGLKTMITGLQQYAKAMEEKSASGLADAMASMSVSDQIGQAETTLEQALGFKLSSD
ncbi:MAG: hypothetical protein ABIH46_03995 [Chloroflexota bacterium]